MERLASSWSLDQLLESYPSIATRDVQVCLAYAIEAVEHYQAIPIWVGHFLVLQGTKLRQSPLPLAKGVCSHCAYRCGARTPRDAEV